MAKNYPRLNVKRLEEFPEALKRLKQWIVWVLSENEAKPKPDKILIDPKWTPYRDSRAASHSDHRTWATYDDAVKFFNAKQTIRYHGKVVPVCGLGFVFSAQDPYTGVDIDDCRDPETGKILDEAAVIVKTLNSYTELSPSGTGLHIIVEAMLPTGTTGRRRSRVEMYSDSRYFTVTGERLAGTPRRVEKRQSELDGVYTVIFGSTAAPPPLPQEEARLTDESKLARVRQIPDETLLEKMRTAANGDKFTELWEEVRPKDHSQADAALCSMLAYWTRRDAERIDRLFRMSSLMRKKWDEKRGSETYGQRTIRFAINGTTTQYDPDLELTLSDPHNDIANTSVMMLLHGDEYMYAKEWNEWCKWDTHHWQQQANLEMHEACEDVSKELMRRAAADPDPDLKRKEKAFKWATTSGDARRVAAIELFARSRLYRSIREFDRDPFLLACENGVIDLRTGTLRDGARADLITRTTGIRYDERARCPIWDDFLADIMQGDKEMIQYLWRTIGYALTGDTTERTFFLFCGDGRNGKSTFVETLKALLGAPGTGYAQKARFSTFLKKNVPGAVNDDVAHFAGARVVIASEADERIPLDVSLVKELTGGDSHRARHLYGREFEFKPQFKLFLVTNKVPPITETTYAIWDRLHYVPFDWRVPEAKIDRALPLKLLGELPGILATAVLYCMQWQKDGLNPPEKVLKAGTELYKDMDTSGQFFTECCRDDRAAETPTMTRHKDLYQAFYNWSKDNGIHRPRSSKWLASELRSRKFISVAMTDNIMHWEGIALIDTVWPSSRRQAS